MADRGTGPQGVASFGNGTTNPADGNNRRKALLQLLMQRARGGGAAGGFGSGSAVSATPFGGLRATPKSRDSQGQGFVKPAQVAAQFVGGLGIGARPGQSQPGSGQAVSRFLPTDGGPVQHHVAPPHSPQAPSAPASDAPQVPGTVVDPSGTGDPFTGGAPGGTLSTDPEHNAFVTGQSDVDPFSVGVGGNTPTSGASGLIPLGNGAYFDPATGQVRYPNSSQAV